LLLDQEGGCYMIAKRGC